MTILDADGHPIGQDLGYARVSTFRQSTDGQWDALVAAGIDPARIYVDKMTGTRSDRPRYQAMLDYARPGDRINVKRVDRLGRDVLESIRCAVELRESGIHVRALEGGADSSTRDGRLIFTILAGIAEWEREGIIERMEDAKAARIARDQPIGRPAVLTAEQRSEVRAMRDEGVRPVRIARLFRVSTRTVYRALQG